MTAIFIVVISAYPTWAAANNESLDTSPSDASQWQACQRLANDDGARLRCYDRWAAQQAPADLTAASTSASAPAPAIITMEAPAAHDCKSRAFSELSRYWELEAGSDCGTFGIRGYKPISLEWIGANSVNTQPSSPSANHTATMATAYSNNEARIGLSVRTKVAQGLLTQGHPLKRDSLWFGYSQQSYWQLFTGDLSRPFRSTDHEPELIYIYPLDADLGHGWRWRYAGWSINHQSNGQSEPLSRSWNRNIVMAGFERGNAFQVLARAWQRVPEAAVNDDNPDIADLVGRAEVAGYWHPNRDNTLGLTLRHSLRAQASGSIKLEWLRRLGDGDMPGSNSGLRFHTQLFSGYGDSLLDYNRRRTVLSVGLSLVDW